MKKTIALVMALLMSLAIFAACSGNSAATTSASADSTEPAATDSATAEASTAATGKYGEGYEFKLGFDAEYPPYGYRDDDGSYTGYDIELAKAVCDKLGWTLKPVPVEWAAKDMELESGSIDCIWNGFTYTGRENEYTWSIPYADNDQVVIVPKDSNIKSISDLAGKVVGTQAGSSTLILFKEGQSCYDIAQTFKEVKEFPDFNTAFVELQSGSIEALAIDIAAAKDNLAKRGEGYVMLDEVLGKEQYAIGFKKGNEELKNIVEAALLETVKDGTYMTLAEKYEIADQMCLKADDAVSTAAASSDASADATASADAAASAA